MPAALERGKSQRDTRFGLGANNGSDPLVAFRQYRVAGKQRGRMSIWAKPEKIYIEQRSTRIEALRAVE